MPRIVAQPLDQQSLAPFELSARLRSQLVYFGTASGSPEVPELGENEFWFDAADVKKWVDDGVINLVSPLDTANTTEVELSEEQEDFLAWLNTNQVQHVRIVE